MFVVSVYQGLDVLLAQLYLPLGSTLVMYPMPGSETGVEARIWCNSESLPLACPEPLFTQVSDLDFEVEFIA
jgi:hypothetical protein